MLVAFVDGSFGVFFHVSESAALPQVVPKEQLTAAIARNQARQQGAGVVSQPLGGFLFAVGRSVPFVCDAVSYAASFVSLLFVRPAFQEARDLTERDLRAEIAEGVRWLWNHRFLRTTMFLVWLWAVMTFAMFLVHDTLLLGVLFGVQALAGPPFNVVIGSYRYLLVPDRLLGRVASAGALVTWGSIPLGSLAAGYLAQELGARSTFLVLGAVFTVVAVAAVSARVIRQAAKLEVVPA